MTKRESFVTQLRIDAEVKQQPNKTWLSVAVVLALVGIVGLLYWAMAQRAQSQMDGQHAIAGSPASTSASTKGEKTREPSPIAISGAFEASGYLVATHSATVTPEVGGRVVEFSVDEGDSVRAGQVIARLADQPARDQLALRESEMQSEIAALEENKADLRNAQLQQARDERLFGQKFVSETAIENDRANVARILGKQSYLNSRVEVAKRTLQATQTTWKNYTIRAPISGVLSKKTAQVGEYISPASYVNAALCTIIDKSSVVAEISVSETNISKVHIGQPVTAVLNSYPNLTFPAKVSSIFPVADRQSGAIRVQVKFDTQDDRLLPDLGVRATFLPK